MTVLEVGANIGVFTVPLARFVHPGGRVIAFEPQRIMYQMLCGNLALNAVDNVVAHNSAAGRSSGSVAVPSVDYGKPGNFGAVSLARSSQGEIVPLVTIDSLALPSCHLIKVDVEGMELDVLEGASSTLRQFRPLLYVENDQPEKSPPLIAYLLALDYRLYWLEPPLYRSDNSRRISSRAPCPPIWFASRAADLWRSPSRIASKSLRPMQNVRAVTRARPRADWMTVPHVKWCLLALVTVIAAPAHAQTFPSKAIRIIVPYAPGGSIDLTARLIAKNLQDSVGQSVIVENKPGANAAIGIEALLRSEPDGHTLVILSDSPVTINVHLSQLNYDPLVDLVPISKVVSSPIILAANAKAGIASIADLVAAAKTKPLSYAIAGRGSASHLAAELLQRELGITMQAVPYRGGAPVAVAIASGDVPLGVVDTAAILPMIRSGQVLALGVAEPVRAQSMPDIPTLREVGVPNFSAPSWLALFAPRGTPQDRIAKLNAEIARIMAMTEAQRVLFAAGLEPATNSPSEMRRIIEADYKKWGQLIAASGLKAE